MTTISKFIETTKKAFPGCEVRFNHPCLYVICEDAIFAEKNQEDRIFEFSRRTGQPVNEIQNVVNRSGLQLILISKEQRETDLSFLDHIERRPNWVELLAGSTAYSNQEQKRPAFLHFYGYKGGQARSTVLCMLAQRLANDGYRVLTVDADLEAPSLPQLFGTVANDLTNTIIGAAMWQLNPRALNVYARDKGIVDLLAARPASHDYDLDYATFVLNSQLDPAPIVAVLSPELVGQYDVVLVDHRSGVASSVVPIAAACSGPVVACMRLDEQSSQGLPYYEMLAALSPVTPGVFLSFSLDPETSERDLQQQHGERIQDYLAPFARLLSKNQAEPVDPSDLMSFWVPWFHDRAFLQSALPKVEGISKDNLASLARIRELTGLASAKITPPPSRSTLPLSGAGGDGAFIKTEKIAQLFQPNTPITYIFGRKGTGKTRLVNELLKDPNNEPLLVASDETAPVKANTALLDQIRDTYESAPDRLWWSLLRAALECQTSRTNEYVERVAKLAEECAKGNTEPLQPLNIAAIANAQKTRRVFLVDAIETAFRPSSMSQYVSSLFRFLATVQSDPNFKNVTIRLFLRSDLADSYGGQNAEQQFAGRRIELVWHAQSIFNFVLSRIASLNWFTQTFPDPCQQILSRMDDIRTGLLTEEEYQPLLLRFFPEKLKGPNLSSLFFLRTYFSDALGDDERNAAFYPRLFEQFLNFIATPSEMTGTSGIDQIDSDGLLNHALVTRAHEQAAKRYLKEVSQELEFLLDFNTATTDTNAAAVRNFLASFNGKRTPFRPDDLANDLVPQNTGIDLAKIRKALDTMRSIGMFEVLQREQSRWRVGRLFKTALGMKFVRG